VTVSESRRIVLRAFYASSRCVTRNLANSCSLSFYAMLAQQLRDIGSYRLRPLCMLAERLGVSEVYPAALKDTQTCI